MPGPQADELCELLMKAGQKFNIAVKNAVEDWAEQMLQADDLKKTISNWVQGDGHRGEEQEARLQESIQTNVNLESQLHGLQERFEKIQFEVATIVKEFERLRDLSGDHDAFRRGLLALFNVRGMK
jgi:hypothetical protein